MSELALKLAEIQKSLVAPKGQRNTFGNYNYRNCEDILSALKPLLGEATITLSDEMVMLGDRFYVKATAKLSLGAEAIEITAFAREAESRKGMNADQLTGATSSYARKYALNGMFAIDDSKDSDSMDNRAMPAKNTPQAKKADYTKEIAAYNSAPQDKAPAYFNSLPADAQKAIIDKANQ